MHEMGIADSILKAVAKELRRYPGAHATKVGVRIGELSAVDPESLQFCFEALVHETEFDPLTLEVQFIQRRHKCRVCEAEFEVRDYMFLCPYCSSLNSECIAGEELNLAYIEVEEHAESANAGKSPERE